MASTTTDESHKQDKQEADFLGHVGTTLGTSVVGIILVILKDTAPQQMFVAPIFLVPTALFALLVALFAKVDRKRTDASHIHTLALAGVLASMAGDSDAVYFSVMTLSLVLMNVANVGRRLDVAPLGSAIAFVPVLAPHSTQAWPATMFVIVCMGLTVLAGRREKAVANTAFAFAATLIATQRLVVPAPHVAAALSLVHVLAIYGLQVARFQTSPSMYERRAYLDDIAAIFALSFFLEAAFAVGETSRYLLIAAVFAGAAACSVAFTRVFRVGGASVGLPAVGERLGRVDWTTRRNTAIAACALSLELAANGLSFPASPILEQASRILAWTILATALFGMGVRTGSFLMRDSAKITAIVASAAGLRAICSADYPRSALSASLTLSLVQFLVIALTLIASSSDLDARRQGAWQGVVDGRALVRIRRARTRVFEFLSKAPIVGWMFHFGDKAATSLQGAFGTSKTWTISHYAICAVVGIGFASTLNLANDIVLNRMPQFGMNPLGDGATPEDLAFRESMVQAIVVYGYAAVLFFIGATLRKKYLRVLATVIAIFMLTTFWFISLSNKEGTWVWIFPLSFCCVVALFRLFIRPVQKAGA
jgi:hypothetical protein